MVLEKGSEIESMRLPPLKRIVHFSGGDFGRSDLADSWSITRTHRLLLDTLGDMLTPF